MGQDHYLGGRRAWPDPRGEMNGLIVVCRWLLSGVGAGLILVLAACASGATQATGVGGHQAAAASSLKVTHYVGGLDVKYGVSGEVDGTIGGHRVLLSGGQRYDGFRLEPSSCRVANGHVYASGELTNTLGKTADFSYTADILNKGNDGTLVSQMPVGTAAFQVYRLPPGEHVTARAIGDITGAATGPKYGCLFYQLVAADSHAVYPY